MRFFRSIITGAMVISLPYALPQIGSANAQSFVGNSVVSAYGAAGNGTTDDSAAFNNCLDPSINTTRVCWVDGGKTYLGGNVVMKSGMRLQGMGMVDYPDRRGSYHEQQFRLQQ